jgi:hypothetical protein
MRYTTMTLTTIVALVAIVMLSGCQSLSDSSSVSTYGITRGAPGSFYAEGRG